MIFDTYQRMGAYVTSWAGTSLMFCESNYAIAKKTRNSVSGLVTTLGGAILPCQYKTQRNMTLSSTEAEYVAFSACVQEAKFVSMLMGEMTEVQNPLFIY